MKPFRFLSLFSGIEAASVAWKPLGWECAGVAEVEPFPSALLRHHYPDVPNLGDVTKITEEQIKQLGHIDLMVGGFPCQDLSVAGKRKGLTHADGTVTRSGLFFTGLKIFQWAEQHCGARFLLIENVPGLFSSNKGRDFGAVVEHMAGLEAVTVPANGWGTEGAAVGDNGLLEWCVLDAQWFHVAQRRRRVFALLDTGDWVSRSPVLLEPEGLRGDSPPSREAGQKPAPALSARTKGGGGRGNDSDSDGGLIAASTSGAGFWREGFGALRGREQDSHENLIGCWWDGGQVSQTLDAVLSKGQAMPEKNRFPAVLQSVAHSLRADGFDASEDGTGRGTPLVPIAFPERMSGTQRASAENLCPSLGAANPTAVAFDLRGREGGAMMEGPHETANIRPASGGSSRSYLATPMAVRRITPTEAERLQGFPDGYTLVPHRGKGAADGPRYKSLGNSFAVPVVRWIGKRIEQALGFSA